MKEEGANGKSAARDARTAASSPCRARHGGSRERHERDETRRGEADGVRSVRGADLRTRGKRRARDMLAQIGQ